MKTTVITLLLLLMQAFVANAQYDEQKMQQILNSDESEMVYHNTMMIQEGYYYQAGIIAQKLLEKNSESCNYNYRRGFIYIEMSSDFINGLPLLEKAVKLTEKNFDAFSAKEKSAPIDAWYHLGRAYHLSEDFEKAKECYNKFLGLSNEKSELIYFCKLRLEQCENGIKAKISPKKVTIKNLGSTINSQAPEYSPVVSLDGTALYYTSRKLWENGASEGNIDPRYNLPPEDIYVSYKDFDGEWIQPTRIDFSSPNVNEATMAVSPDERRVYVYIDSIGNGDVFYSDFSSNKFSDLNHFEERSVNQKSSWEPHCTVSPDGLQMYFVSDREGGFGGRDIYRIVKMADGTWSKPVNLGPNINGPLDEDSPFIAADNKTLYFGSNGNKSIGGFDIFMSIIDNEGNFSGAVNLGYPINSGGDDLFYTTTIDGLTGYITSFRKDGQGEKDIYEIQNDYLGIKGSAILKGKINTYDNEPLPEDVSITLRCLNCGNKVDRKVFPRLRDGVFMSTLEPCREYEMLFSYENGEKEFYNEKFNTECNESIQTIEREVWLDTKTKKISQPYVFMGDAHEEPSKKRVPGVKVTIIDPETNEVYGSYTTDNDGFFKSDTLKNFKLGQKKNLVFKLEKEGFITTTHDLDLTFGKERTIDVSKLISTSLIKKDIGVDLAVLLNPIYYDFDKSYIRPDAAIELDKIVTIMKDNPGLKIALGSHTDARGDDAYNLKLSQARAKAALNYIISKGIAANRITGKGYGETKLKVSNGAIDAMSSEAEKDAAHQLNRRTEFIIVK